MVGTVTLVTHTQADYDDNVAADDEEDNDDHDDDHDGHGRMR